MGYSLKKTIIHPTPSMQFDPAWDKSANCYAYALNNPQLGARTPGDLGKSVGAWLHKAPANPPEWVREALIRDGLIPATRQDIRNRQQHLIAAFAAPYFFDFHFYRRDVDGTWSHKPKDRQPLNLTSQFTAIRNPKKVTDERAYTFLGYYRVPEEGIPALII